MRTSSSKSFRRQRAAARGFLQMDLVVALAILALAVFPMAFAFTHERQLLRIEYQRAVAAEIVDGEAEILAASSWQNVPDGSHAYPISAKAAAHLPPGHFELTKTGQHLRLQWLPDSRRGLGAITREVMIK